MRYIAHHVVTIKSRTFSSFEPVRGLVKLKKIKKIREKLGLVRPNTQKTQNSPPPQKKSELGLEPPTHFRVFLGFFDFF